MYAAPRSIYLFQCGVRDTIAGQAQFVHDLIELLEERGKGPISGSGVGQYEGDLLTDALQEDRLGNVPPHKLSHMVQISPKKSTNKRFLQNILIL